MTDEEETFLIEEESERPVGDSGTATASQPEDTPIWPKATPFTSLIGQKERSDSKNL